MKQVLKWILISSLFFILLLVASATWLFNTESGLQTSWSLVERYMPATLTVTEVKGTLADKVSFSDIIYQDESGNEFTINEISLKLSVEKLFYGNLVVSQLILDDVNISLSAMENKEPTPLDIDFWLPIPVYLENLSIKSISQHKDNKPDLPLLEDLEARLYLLGHTLAIEKLEFIASSKVVANINGEIALKDIAAISLEFNWSVNTEKYVLAGSGEAKGDLEELTIEHALVEPYQLMQRAHISNLMDDLSWTLASYAEQLDLEQINQQGILKKLNIEAKGDRTSAVINMETQALLVDKTEVELSIDIKTNDFNSWKINQGLVKLKEVGELELAGEIRINQSAPEFKLAGQWQHISLPDDLVKVPIELFSGEFKLTGLISDYQLDFNASLEINQQPLQLSFSATGTENGFNTLQIHSQSGLGETIFNGDLNWDEILRLSGEMKLINFNPIIFGADWPGSLTGSTKLLLSTSLSAETDNKVAVHDLYLSGIVRQRPVTLKADFETDLKQIQISDLQLMSGQSSLIAHGSISDKLSIRWQLTSPDMVDFHPDMSGRVDAKGQLNGELTQPAIKAVIDAENLSFLTDYRAEKLSVSLEADFKDIGIFQLEATVNGLQFGASTIQNFQLFTSGRTDNHEIAIKIIDDDNSLTAKLKGGFNQSIWQGELSNLNITLPVAGNSNWNLANVSKISLSSQQITLDKICLKNKLSVLCTKMNFKQDGNWQTEGQFNNVPVGLFHPFYKPLRRLNGDIKGHFSVSGKNSYPIKGEGQLALIKGNIQLLDEQGVINFLETKMDFSLTDAAVTAELFITPDIKGVSPLHGQFSSASFNKIIEQAEKVAVKGRLHFSVDNLSNLQYLHHEYENLQGALKVDLDLSGTAEAPALSGKIKLIDGGLYLPRLDIQLENFNINAKGQLGDGLIVDYSVNSGEGQLYGDGLIHVDTQTGWLFNGHIKGKQFEAVNLPEIWGTLSPNLELTITPESALIKGTILIDEAEIVPLKYAVPVTTSQDVIVIRTTIEPEKQTMRPPITTVVDVTIQLGNNVRVIADDINILFSGDLKLFTDTDNNLLATGELTMLDGLESLNDRRLKLENGRIIYSNNPLSSPDIDIKVERTQDDVIAGAHILGQFNKTQVTFFSTPKMTDEEIIIHLITGDSSSTATNLLIRLMTGSGGLSGGRGIQNKIGLDTLKLSGTGGDDTTVELGKYLAPGLYVGYGVGLLDQLSTVIIRYKLSDIWAIRAESGEQTGADLLFTHER